MSQRSIRGQDLAVWELYADREKPAPGGAIHLELSHAATEEAQAAGVPADQLRRLRKLRVVVADGAALTVYRVPSRQNSNLGSFPSEQTESHQ